MSRAHTLFCLAVLLTLTACEGDTKQTAYRNEKDEYGDPKAGSVFGSGGLDLFGLNKKPGDGGSGGDGRLASIWRCKPNHPRGAQRSGGQAEAGREILERTAFRDAAK